LVYDSNYSDRGTLPETPEEIDALFQSLQEDEILILLGSNPCSIENELSAMVVRGHEDWEFCISNLYPKLLVRAKLSAARGLIGRQDMKESW
jgi:hypothetical protein